MLVDRAPQVPQPAVDPDEHLVEVPLVAEARAPPQRRSASAASVRQLPRGAAAASSSATIVDVQERLTRHACLDSQNLGVSPGLVKVNGSTIGMATEVDGFQVRVYAT